MKNKLTLLDLKDSLWDKRFRELFPELKDQIRTYLKDPGCSCNIAFLRGFFHYKDRLQKFFPTKEIVTPEEEDAVLGTNDWVVINCPVDQLETKLKDLPKGKRMMAAARFKDRCTVIINSVEAAFHISAQDVEKHMNDAKNADLNWRVINCSIHDLQKELGKLPQGRKMINASRFQDQITVVVSDLAVLF